MIRSLCIYVWHIYHNSIREKERERECVLCMYVSKCVQRVVCIHYVFEMMCTRMCMYIVVHSYLVCLDKILINSMQLCKCDFRLFAPIMFINNAECAD